MGSLGQVCDWIFPTIPALTSAKEGVMEAWVTTGGSVFDGLWLRMGLRLREGSSMKNKESLVMEQ